MRIRPLHGRLGIAAAAGLLVVACGGPVAATAPVHHQATPAATAPAGPLVSTASRTVGGGPETVLTDSRGRTLYYFTPEKDGKIVTTADTLETWPVLAAGSATTPSSGQPLPGKLGIVTRPDGTRQVTYNEFPLYTFTGDKTPGDTSGQGVGGRWFAMQSVLPPDADGDGDGTQPAAQTPAQTPATQQPAMQQAPAATPQPPMGGQPMAQPKSPAPAPAAAPAARPTSPSFNDGDADNRGGDNDGDGNG